MGVLDRLILRDDHWERMSAHVGAYHRATSGREVRQAATTGWSWKQCFGSFARGAICAMHSEIGTASSAGSAGGAVGVWRIFAAKSDDPDFEYLIVDSIIIRAHQHASGAKKGV
ncbi:putative transposase [Mesorhizobium sp. URHB0026]